MFERVAVQVIKQSSTVLRKALDDRDVVQMLIRTQHPSKLFLPVSKSNNDFPFLHLCCMEVINVRFSTS